MKCAVSSRPGRHRGLNQDDRCFSSRSFSRRAGLISFALCSAACSGLHLHALRRRHGTAPEGRSPELQLVGVLAFLHRRLFRRLHFFWSIRQCRRRFPQTESQCSDAHRRCTHPSFRSASSRPFSLAVCFRPLFFVLFLPFFFVCSAVPSLSLYKQPRLSHYALSTLY